MSEDLGAADERARAEWEDGEGAGVVTSAGIWHAALQYERRRVAGMDGALRDEVEQYRNLYGPVDAPNARATHQQLKQMADDARAEVELWTRRCDENAERYFKARDLLSNYRAALESIATAPAFDANTQSLVDLARRTLAP